MYLAASDETISRVLTIERDQKQLTIHFVNMELQGLELNYPIQEKLIFALIYVARRLRRYFQTHKVVVLTSFLVKKIFLRPKKSGQLVKLVVDLREHDIDYRP